jgi:cell division initiation protein
MRVTPLDIRKQTFRRTLQGFSRDDVIAYLGLVADELETLTTENKTLLDRSASLEFQLASYKEIEGSLRNAMVMAERAAEEVRKQAAKEEEVRLREVELKVQRVVEEAHGRIRDLKREIRELEKEKTAFLARFRLLIEAQLKMLDLKIEDDEEENLSRVAGLQSELWNELEREEGERDTGREADALEARERIERRAP